MELSYLFFGLVLWSSTFVPGLETGWLGFCQKVMSPLPPEVQQKICEESRWLHSCVKDSYGIFFWSPVAADSKPRRILVLGGIHGDEPESVELVIQWMYRLLREVPNPRNHWIFIPVANPAGWLSRKRTNDEGIDLNRNFPTQDWNQAAQEFWHKQARADPRKFPGHQAAQAWEVRCLIQVLQEIQPHLVVSIHTPLGVLDWDGLPELIKGLWGPVAWRRLGHFPGSLGRYLWYERQVPVLTIELNQNFKNKIKEWLKFQDVVGDLALKVLPFQQAVGYGF